MILVNRRPAQTTKVVQAPSRTSPGPSPFFLSLAAHSMASPAADRAVAWLVLGGDMPSPHAAHGIETHARRTFNSGGCMRCEERKEERRGPSSSALPIDLINRNNFRLIVDGSSQLMHHANPVRVVIRTPPLQDIAASQLFEDVLR